MSNVVIENPVINSPFAEPTRHFRFTEDGITDEIVEGRRISAYFIPIPRPRKKGGQLAFDEWTQDRIEENPLVNQIRHRVGLWRQGNYPGVTPTTARLLEYWTHPDREKKFFFCQIEAMETVIYITEAARKFGDAWIENKLREANDLSNPGLPRIALKMATGSGKTVVMGMLIAWHALNKLANPQDNRFSDTFLLITPGLTIRDRLRVLLPNDPGNYYQARDIVSPELLEKLGSARILITNFHAFALREKITASRLTKSILSNGADGIFTESPEQMLRRVCRELGSKKNIVVINDEAHHCYRRKPDAKSNVPQLVNDYDDPENFQKKASFYEHNRSWSNRMILGGSLPVMNSLTAKKGLKGTIQTIHFDSPSGIKFRSNRQASTCCLESPKTFRNTFGEAG